VQNHRNLKVWQKAHAFCVQLYRVTGALERTDRSGLASQVRRASHSIRANIAEGCSRPTNKDFAKFLQTAIASASEVEDHLQFAHDVELIEPNDSSSLLRQIVEIRKMLYGLVRRVQDDKGDEDE
jgi:four helix bundle protein